MKHGKRHILIAFFFAASAVLGEQTSQHFRAPRLGVVCNTPAQARQGVKKSRAWEQSLLTGNGAMGAMVPGELAHEEIYLSHARIFLPRVMNGRYFELGKYREKARELALAGREKEIWDEVIQKASEESGYSFKRDPFMGAVSLVVDTPDLPDWRDAPQYARMTDFERGECTVRMDDYERGIFASRPDGVIAMRVTDAKKRPFTVRFETISNGRPSGDAAIQDVREKDGYMYYRVDFRKENGKNPFHGYEAVGLRKGDEVFVKIYPLPFGTDSMFETAKRELAAAADTGYAQLLERHAPIMTELMGRVSLDLPDRDLVRKFHACRYNIISSTGPGGVLPNLQGLWAGSWSAPYNGSYTVDGNMPCAMSFWTRGNTPEFNESLYEWIMRYYADFREAAQKGYNARGIHIPGQVTTTGLETAYYRNVELMWWHGGAGWMTGYLWRWYEATQDIEVLKKIYPLLKDAADYICDCMEEMPDGTLGFAPGYSPENAPHGDFRSQGDVMDPDMPKGGYSTQNNPTMDVSVAKQSIDYATKAAKILNCDEASVLEWAQKRERLPPYAVSPDGFWAEWLIQGGLDNNSHRHVSHLFALYDEAPAEILTNAAFVAAIKKTLDARMSFHEKEHHMAFGVTQIGYVAAKVGDAAVMERAIKLLQETYFTDALGTLHDPGWLFNIDICGGFPGIIADALITKGPDGGFQILNAKPASWTKGSISGLLLPGDVKVKKLSWQGDSYELELLHPDGRTETLHPVSGQAAESRETESVVSGAKFIGAGAANGAKPAYVRREVMNAKNVVNAVWRVTGLGVFTPIVNIKRCSSSPGESETLMPGYTHFKKRRHEITLDVTDKWNCAAGATNVLSAIVTSGWWCDGIAGKSGGTWPAFRGVLALTYGDGTATEIPTDESWLVTTDTPVVKAGIWEGESYDATKSVITDEAHWEAAKVSDEFKGEISPRIGPPVVMRTDLALCCEREDGKPVPFCYQVKPGETNIVDFGQNCAAVPYMQFSAEPGTKVTVRLGEMLNDGIDRHHGDGPKGSVYLANMRGASATFEYVCKGGARPDGTMERYCPMHTFYGYRYAAISADKPLLLAIASVPVTSVSKEMERGEIETGDERVNRLVNNAYWSMLSNYLSVPTDCPQRTERLGWTGDTQVFAKTGCYFADVRGFFAKWMQDVRDTQHADGVVPYVVPLGVFGDNGPVAGWSDAAVIVPWTLWRQLGDEELVRRNWDVMERYMARIASDGYMSKRGDWLLCDWLSFEKLSVDQSKHWSNGGYTEDHLSYQNFLNACHLYGDALKMSELAAVLSLRQALDYADLARRTKERILATWFRADGTLCDLFDGMQTPALFALKLGLGDRERIASALVAAIHANGDRLATGFLGTPLICEVLSEIGQTRLAYTLLLQREFPSWLYSVDQGATTIWERWNGYTKEGGFGDARMNSFNHYAYGAVVGWLFEHAAGIKPDAVHGGWRHFTLAPEPDERLGRLSAKYKTDFGVIESAWEYGNDGAVHYRFVVPPGTTATLRLPDGEGAELSEGEFEKTVPAQKDVRAATFAEAASCVAAAARRVIRNDAWWDTVDGAAIYSNGGGCYFYGGRWYWYGCKYEESERARFDRSFRVDVGGLHATFAGVTCYSSSDLVNWRDEGIVYAGEGVKGVGRFGWFGRVGVAAVPSEGKFVLAMQYGGGVLLAVADSPSGPFVFQEGVDMTASIGFRTTGDQSVFYDDINGKGYLVFSKPRGRDKTYVAELGYRDGRAYVGEPILVLEGHGREGNCMFMHRGRYYICASDLYGWDASHGYWMVADSPLGPYRKAPDGDMFLIRNASEDYCHISQTGFFVTVRGTDQETVIFCGDRWTQFADNGIGFNVWTPLSFDGDEPAFNSLSEWMLDAATGRWSVGPGNNYVRNGSFDADRRQIPIRKKPDQDFVSGWTVEPEGGFLNATNMPSDKAFVTGKFALNLPAPFPRRAFQRIDGIPDGDYTLRYWRDDGKGWLRHEKSVSVTNGTHVVEFIADAPCRIDDVALVFANPPGSESSPLSLRQQNFVIHNLSQRDGDTE